MRKIDVSRFSTRYDVRKMNMRDSESIYAFCNAHTVYYEHCGKELTLELIEQDLQITPPEIPAEQKHYVGFFDGDKLIAVMDLIDGYPEDAYAYIGFFMMNNDLQGRGIGSEILAGVFAYLKELGFEKCQLGIDKDNPQSNHFWKKNGFEVIREVELEVGMILVAEREL